MAIRILGSPMMLMNTTITRHRGMKVPNGSDVPSSSRPMVAMARQDRTVPVISWDLMCAVPRVSAMNRAK